MFNYFWRKKKKPNAVLLFPKTFVSPEIIIHHTNNKADEWEVEAFQTHSHMDPWGPVSIKEDEAVDVLLAADWVRSSVRVLLCELGGGPSAPKASLCPKYKQSGQLQQRSMVICHATASSMLSAQHTHTSSRESEVSAWLYLVSWAWLTPSHSIKGFPWIADQTHLTD